MRVIAGTARRLPLVTPKGMETRPTTDRIKETLFNILQNDLPGCHFLDLFAGSGAIGIEALSRGAAKAVFVDNSKEALSCIRQNLEKTHLADRAIVIGQDCAGAIHALDAKKMHFDIIFMDPPYHLDLEERIVPYLLQSSLVKAGSLIIVETALDTVVDYMYELGCEVERIKEYKTNRHVFLRVPGETEA